MFVLAARSVPESTDPTSSQPIDYPGLVVLTASLFALTFALIEGQKYGWTSGLDRGVVRRRPLVGLVVFVLIEARQAGAA